MKICYIWVENFRNFRNTGINFSSSAKFKYDINTNVISREDLKPLSDTFFNDEGRISDVTALIGKNGSGKSNALDLLLKAVKGSKSTLNTNFFIITEEYGKYICHLSFRAYDRPPITNRTDIRFIRYDGSINFLKVVFFSNVYDNRTNIFHKDVVDLSLNKQSKRRPFYRKENNENPQIEFINSPYFDLLNIEIPEEVVLTSRVTRRRNYSIGSGRKMYGEYYEVLEEFKHRIDIRIRDIKGENMLLILIKAAFILDVLDVVVKDSNHTSVLKIVNEFSKFNRDFEESRTQQLLDSIIKWLEELLSKSEYKYLMIEEFSLKIFLRKLDFIHSLKNLFKRIKLRHYTEGSRRNLLKRFILPVNNETKGFLHELNRLFTNNDYFDIDWLGISSGHKAYLNLFSSIYKELKFARSPYLLLCIDEGDLYLHPKWQLEFFDKLRTIIPQIFPGDIQLVLTSHSPFLLSDLPKQCVTIIDPDSNGNLVDGYQLKLNTFAGNIYDLYSNPFFLGDNRISAFATNKLEKVFEILSMNDKSGKDTKLAKSIIDLIGDEMISFQLNNKIKND